MACTDAETNVRGFDAWMSADEEGTASVDPLRLRNLEMSSTVFGAANLVCDASVYDAAAVYFNDLYVNSRWNPTATADPTVPGMDMPWEDQPEDQQQYETGIPSRDPTDTPLVDPHDTLMPHSVGLLRDWFPRADPLSWPHWETDWNSSWTEFPDAYASGEADSKCAPPRIRTCLSDDECLGSVETPLRCMRHSTWIGVCMRKDTCFKHAHFPPLSCARETESVSLLPSRCPISSAWTWHCKCMRVPARTTLPAVTFNASPILPRQADCANSVTGTTSDNSRV